MSLHGRVQNSDNSNQGKALRVLCVCSAGLLRSPTAAFILSNAPYNFNTRSAGIESSYALIVVDEPLLVWADLIICMDKHQAKRLKDMYNNIQYGAYKSPEIIVLDTPDIYGFKHPKLMEIMSNKFAAKFPDGVYIKDQPCL